MKFNPYFMGCGIVMASFLATTVPDLNARPNPRDHYAPISTDELLIWPGNNDSIPYGTCDEIKISLPESMPGRIIVNNPYTAANNLRIRLIKVSSDNPPVDPKIPDPSNQEEPDTGTELPVIAEDEPDAATCHILEPVVDRSGRFVSLYIDRQLDNGDWRLEIPDRYFEVQPEPIYAEELPFPKEDLLKLDIPGAWHKPGETWNARPMFSIHDDDGVDGKIPSCGSSHIPDRNGYFTILYPLLQSLEVKGNVSMEGWRCGMTADPPQINDNGRIMLRLEQELGWEMQGHSMEVLGDRNNNWYVDSLDTPLADMILAEASGRGFGNATTSVYDALTDKQYYPSDDRTHWIESPQRYIKPYALDYKTKLPVTYIRDHDVDYHWGEWFRIAREWGFQAESWVQHNAITSHDYASHILTHAPNGFSDLTPPEQYNVPPLRSTATRMLVEGQSAPGYIGESSDDNRYDHRQFEWFCDYIDRCVADKGWIILGLHAYRKCWKNYLPGSLVSEGGDYPDEWVDPLQGMDYLNDSLITPPERLGITEWSEWYPCPGTRLDMLRDLILYCLNCGMMNVTSSQGFGIMGNRTSAGYFNNGIRCGNDRFRLTDDRDTYPHYIESATGEVSYYNPLVTDPISSEFTIVDPGEITNVSTILYRGPVLYFDLWGNPVDRRNLGKGIYIKFDGNGVRKIVR